MRWRRQSTGSESLPPLNNHVLSCFGKQHVSWCGKGGSQLSQGSASTLTPWQYNFFWFLELMWYEDHLGLVDREEFSRV